MRINFLMGSFALSLTCFFCMNASKALGTPEQDYNISQLKALFNSSVQTTINKEKLLVGKKWVCNFYSAEKDNTEILRQSFFYKFISSANLVFNEYGVESVGEFSGSSFSSSKNNCLTEYWYSPNGKTLYSQCPMTLHEKNKIVNSYEYLRITSSGNLIAELLGSPEINDVKTHEKASRDTSFLLLGYTYCPKEWAVDVIE